MDYYNTLGLKRGASADEIKKAYRKLAMQHHPDRGGDEAMFKKISEAYDVLSDPQKRQMFDSGVDPNAQQNFGGGWANQGGPFEFHFGGMPPDMEHIFGGFGFNFGGQQRRPQRNKSFSVTIAIDLEDVITGKEVNAEIGVPGGAKKMVSIKIPPGINSGQQIRYQGMGDSSIAGIPPGDLIVNIVIQNHERFQRDGDHLVYEHKLSAWRAMLGGTVTIETLDKRTIDVTIPPGAQPDTVLSCRNEGLPNMRSKHKGNLYIRLLIEIPKDLTDEQRQFIQSIADAAGN